MIIQANIPNLETLPDPIVLAGTYVQVRGPYANSVAYAAGLSVNGEVVSPTYFETFKTEVSRIWGEVYVREVA